MRGESGGGTGLRGSRAARLTGAGLAVLLAAAGVTVYLIVDGSGKSGDASLPTRVLSTQAISLVSPGSAGTTSTGPASTGPGVHEDEIHSHEPLFGRGCTRSRRLVT